MGGVGGRGKGGCSLLSVPVCGGKKRARRGSLGYSQEREDRRTDRRGGAKLVPLGRAEISDKKRKVLLVGRETNNRDSVREMVSFEQELSRVRVYRKL